MYALLNYLSKRRVVIVCWLTGLILMGMCPLSAQTQPETKLKITVDATELPRKLLHTTIKLNLNGEEASLLYPKWIPAFHGPVGPVENLIELAVTGADGELLRWERDWTDFNRFFVFPSHESEFCTITLSSICNQGGTTAGFSTMGIIDWYTAVLYPEGIPISEIKVDLKLILPANWQFGSALPYKETRGDTLLFSTITFEELIDAPLICGVDFRTVELATTPNATYFLHMVAHHPDDLPDKDNDTIMTHFTTMMHEAEALFTRTHFDNYHFLLVFSDEIGYLGLEHRNSSLNMVKSRSMYEGNWYEAVVPELLAHEMVHAWCGKYRRPEGMATQDYQTPKNLDLLWMYEGLTTYLGWLLPSRSGFWDFQLAKDWLANDAAYLLRQKGRRWQPLRDVQIATHIMWGASDSWRFHSRSADYYREGAQLWLEIDARIRTLTDGAKSLDDFCAQFFSDGDPTIHYNPFSLEDVIANLNQLVPQPWDSLLDVRLNQTQQEYSADFLTWIGYRLDFTDQKSIPIMFTEKRRKWYELYESIGLAIKDDGCVIDVVPGSPADLTGLYAGVTIIGINDRRFTFDRLESAVRHSMDNGYIKLLTLHDDSFVQTKIDYKGGLRYYTIKPQKDKRDWLSEIVKPIATE